MACLGVEVCHLLVIVRQLLLADVRVHHLLGEAGRVQQRACMMPKLSKLRVLNSHLGSKWGSTAGRIL